MALPIGKDSTRYLGTDSQALRQAIDAHRDTITAATLTVQWLTEPPAGAAPTTVKIDGQPLTIALTRVPRA